MFIPHISPESLRLMPNDTPGPRTLTPPLPALAPLSLSPPPPSIASGPLSYPQLAQPVPGVQCEQLLWTCLLSELWRPWLEGVPWMG